MLSRLVFCVLLALLGCSDRKVSFRYVSAQAETTPVSSPEDAADNPAIWVNPSDPQRSLIIGTNKNQQSGGLDIYDLRGQLVQRIRDPGLNNADLRQNVLGSSSVLTATRRTDSTLAVYAIDSNGSFTRIDSQQIRLLDPYSLCMGYFKDTRELVVAVTGKSGWVERLRLLISDSALRYENLAEMQFPSQIEGCVIDDDLKILWVAEENRGIYRCAWDSANSCVLMDSLSSRYLKADLEGLALYVAEEKGYLIASSQGNHSYAFYDRRYPFTYTEALCVSAIQAALTGHPKPMVSRRLPLFSDRNSQKEYSSFRMAIIASIIRISRS